MAEEQGTDVELKSRFLNSFQILIGGYTYPHCILSDSGQGWETDGMCIVPLYSELLEQKERIERGESTVQGFYERYIGLFDKDFDLYLGLPKPITVWELLITFHEMLIKEITKRDSQYQVVLMNKEVCGVFYLYDYHSTGKRASLGIGVSSQYRGVGLAELIVRGYIQNFMQKDKPEVLRLLSVIEKANEHSIKLFHKLSFKFEGSADNFYGSTEDVVFYTYLAEPRV